MKTIAFLLFVALSAADSQSNSIGDMLKDLKQYTDILKNAVNTSLLFGGSSFEDFLPFHQSRISGMNVTHQRIGDILEILANMGIGLAGGFGNVQWKDEEGGMEATAVGGEIEIKFGSCSTDRDTPEGDASNTKIFKILQAVLSGIPAANVSAQYPEDVFRGFGHSEISVANRNLQVLPTCDDNQLKNVTVSGRAHGDVEGTGIIIAAGRAEDCDPAKGVGIAQAKGITGRGKIIGGDGDIFAMAFGNAVDLAS